MSQLKTYRALGLASGSELDGLRCSVIVSDGIDVFDIGKTREFVFDDDLREGLRLLHKNYPNVEEVQKEIIEDKFSQFCTAAVKEIMAEDPEINLIGSGGHIICHKPNEHFLCQIGGEQEIAQACGVKTVGKFRDADILSGGMGAPLAAIYHMALSQKLEKPLVWIDVGGISALTYIGQNGEIRAFDTGAGNAIINEWVDRHANMHMDYNGKLAITGKVNQDILSALMRHKFLSQIPPKAADKNLFIDKSEHLEGLSLEDGAATATAFVTESIMKAIADFIDDKPQKIIVCGGGAKNPSLMRFLRQKAEGMEVCTAEECGFDSLGIEAQAFAFLAIRRCNAMPISYPFTTGAAVEVIGGEVFEPTNNKA